MRPELGSVILCITLSFSLFGSLQSYGADTTAAKMDGSTLEELLAEYVNWSANVPSEELPGQDNVGSPCIINKGSVIFLLDPFSKGTVSQTCTIDSGSSMLFPFYLGWCDSGSTELYNITDYEKILPCALDADKGIVTMQAWLDDKKIIDIKVDNKDPRNPKLVYNKLPQNDIYKEVRTNNTHNITITNNVNLPSAYAHPEDFESKPAVYKAVVHCFCGIVGNLTSGTHQLRYNTIIEGTGGITEGDSWDQVTDVTYKLNVR